MVRSGRGGDFFRGSPFVTLALRGAFAVLGVHEQEERKREHGGEDTDDDRDARFER